MAKSIFKGKTTKEIAAIRRRQRENKRKAAQSKKNKTTPRFKKSSTRELKKKAKEAKETFKTTRTKKSTEAVQDLVPDKLKVKSPENLSQDFERQFLEIIKFLPGEKRDQALSLFSVFQTMDEAGQQNLLEGLMDEAEQATGPIFDLYRQRLKEDAEFSEGQVGRSISTAKSNFERLSRTLDFNAARTKAKEDAELAKTIRRVTSSSFTGGLAGSGIIRRRTREDRVRTAERKTDIDIDVNQKKGSASAALTQFMNNANASLDRIKQLEDRGEFDLAQEEEEDTRSLFLDLFENELTGLADQAREALPSGAVGSDLLNESTRITGEGVASDVFKNREARREAVEGDAEKQIEEAEKARREGLAFLKKHGSKGSSAFDIESDFASKIQAILAKQQARSVSRDNRFSMATGLPSFDTIDPVGGGDFTFGKQISNALGGFTGAITPSGTVRRAPSSNSTFQLPRQQQSSASAIAKFIGKPVAKTAPGRNIQSNVASRKSKRLFGN